MPLFNSNPPPYKPRAGISAQWKDLRKGLNMLLRPTELGTDEYEQGDNIMLIGSGVPTGRWGTTTYFTANATGAVRGIMTFANTATLTKDILAVTDEGFISKKNGSTSTQITGISYPSGSYLRSEQLGGKTYIVNKNRPFVTYAGGTTVDVFATISAPTNALATNLSGVTGSYTQSWRITALGPNGGETTGSTAVILPNLPQDLTATKVRVSWTRPSASSLSAFQIYRGQPGAESYLAAVGASTTVYDDVGDPGSTIRLVPATNTTGGIISDIIAKFNDRLIMVDANDRTKLLISGRYPYQGRFSWADGGGYAYIDPDSGTDITGVAVQPGTNKVVVYKDYSHYEVTLGTVAIGNYLVLDPTYQPISTQVGACNPDVIEVVENDIFYFGRKGLYVTGYEPNFMNTIRTNEISARMRPYLQRLGANDYRNVNAAYIDNKYLLSFPDRKEMLVYDRERGSFVGIWKLPFGITRMEVVVDSAGTERWIIGTAESNQLYTFEASVNSDNGTTITKTLRLNKEAFSSWTELKILEYFYILFRNITGEVTVNILLEDRNGTTSVVETFTITGAAVSGHSGWGASVWGSMLWGKTKGAPVSGGDELTRWGQLYKSGRLVQIEIVCNKPNSNFELLSAEITAKPQGKGSLSSSQRV